MLCPSCSSNRIDKAGLRYLWDGSAVQRFQCKRCGYRFSEGHNSSKTSRTNRGRQLCAVLEEAKKLDARAEIKTVTAGEQNTRGLLLQFALYLQKQGRTASTINGYIIKLGTLARNADLNDPESVKLCISKNGRVTNSKATLVNVYNTFLKWQGKSWDKPRYRLTSPIPEFIPTEQEIDALIAGCGKKLSAMLQTIKETGMRLGECLSLTWTALNDKDSILTLNTPEKNGLPRTWKISPKLTIMLQSMPKKTDRIFGRSTAISAGANFLKQRKRLALKLGNPRLAKIHAHLIRHWYGTMELHKCHDLNIVKNKMGHRNISSTEIYLHTEQVAFATDSDEWNVKGVASAEEAMKLIAVGFEFVAEMDGLKVLRKRK
jgi:integrase